MGKLIINGPRSFEWRPDGMAIEIEGEVGEFSDGYHSFNDLYAHRHGLFIALMRCNPELSYIARQHADGTEYPGWFLAVMNLPNGQVSYHMPMSYWDEFDGIKAYERAPSYDGHTSQDMLDRLRTWRGVKAVSSGLNSLASS
jgi:hypothetical protein